MMKVVIVAILALATALVSAYDPSPLQDFCVAINNTDSAGMYMHALSLLLAVRSSIITIYKFFRDHYNEVLHINEIMPNGYIICIRFLFFFPLHDMLLSIVTEPSYL